MKKDKFLKVAQKSHFFQPHEKVLVAVSGGGDSLNLFHTLYACRVELQIEIGMIHVNHCQRKESDEEEAYLRNLAQELYVPFYCSHFTGDFSEKKARDFRYAFFKNILEEQSYTALVTAHHADDQAETIFMRWLRGSRLQHLAGIVSVQDFGSGRLIRPFLSFKKAELGDCFYFEDASNAENTYLRNRIRNQYIPSLSQENPQFSDSLVKLGQEVETYSQALHDLTKTIHTTNVTEFKRQTLAVQSVLLEFYLEGFPDLELSKEQFEEVLHILQTKANYQGHLKNGYYLMKDYRQFSIQKIQPRTDSQSQELVIKSQGIYSFKDYLVALDEKLDGAEQLLYIKKNLPLVLRERRAGDIIQVNGVGKKIRRYFIDEKIAQTRRETSFIIEQEKNIYGIAHIVASDLSKSLKNDTMKSILYIKAKV